jgi:aerobic carbon-monoxide dehydrogenase large subunit
VKIAVDSSGIIEAIGMEHVADVGAYPVCPFAIADPYLLPGPYRIGQLGFSSQTVWTNTMGRGAYRGPWLFETTAREMALDVTARKLGMDPVELRRLNLLSLEELPYTSAGGKVFQEITPLETFEKALEMLDLRAFRTEQTAARAGGRLLGMGVSVYVEPTAVEGPANGTEAATVKVEASGQVTVFLSSTSYGQSHETTMAQIVADGLGVDYEDVSVVQADTRSTPYGAGTGGSKTAVIGGGAAHEAAVSVRDQVISVAGQMMEAAVEDLELSGGKVAVRGVPDRSVSLKEVATQAYTNTDLLPMEMRCGLEATIRFRPTRRPTWANATHVCVVEIDGDTFIPKVVRYIVVEDCGRMINPQVVDGQVCGGVVQGIGGVLYEDFRYDAEGNPLTTTFLDYLLPTSDVVPTIEVGHLQTVSTSNPGGFKGVGEGGAIGAHAAVANAVGDALAHLGVVVRSTPLGPENIFRLVQNAAGADAGGEP